MASTTVSASRTWLPLTTRAFMRLDSPAPLRHKIRYLALEKDLASQLFNLCPYGFDNAA